MSFAAPWLALAGIALALLPYWIHRWTRPTPLRVKFSAMRFLEEVQADLGRRAQLRDRLVLAVRMLAIVLFALALGRARRPGIAPTGDLVDRVVVLDASRSMGARPGGIAVFERARALALERLVGPPTLRAGLVMAGATARAVFDEPSANVGALREELRKVEPRPEALDAGAALTRALELLAHTPAGRRRELVVVTDLQRGAWESVDLGMVPADVQVAFDVAASRMPARNFGVTAVRSAPPGAEAGWALDVEVFNGSDQPREAAVELACGERVERALVTVGAWQARAARFALPGARGERVTGAARLTAANDDLPEDDRRVFAILAEKAPVVAVATAASGRRGKAAAVLVGRALGEKAGKEQATLDREPGTGNREVGTEPGNGGTGIDTVRHVASAELSAETLAAVDALWLVNAGALSPDAVNAVTAFVARGRGVVAVAGDAADAEGVSRVVAALARSAPTEAPPFGLIAAPPDRPVPELTLARVDAARRPFAAFSPAVRAHLATIGVRRPVAISLGAGPRSAHGSDVLASFSDGSPAVVLCAAGEGRLAVFAADLGASPLARSPLWVPLAAELTAAVRSEAVERPQELSCGRPALVALAPAPRGTGAPVLHGPDGRAASGVTVDERASGPVLRWQPDAPGLYVLKRGETTLDVFAVECPASESDLRPLAADRLRARAGTGPRIFVQGDVPEADAPGGVPLWPLFALAAAAACMLEAGLLAWWRA